jgi:ATP-dependent helicase HrpB
MREGLPQLPISTALPALSAALAQGRNALIQAPPGAGKSTLVPLHISGSPWLGSSKILMLEPRRIAARAVAQRMAQLCGEAVGQHIGYRTRLETRVSRETRIEVVTEGILTRMLQNDASLAGIGCVIFDEFHERSLHADLGLALALESQQSLREDLRLLVMSATLDLLPLTRLLNDAPVITAAGRSFEVETRYVPRRTELPIEQQVAQTVRVALRDDEGDILCFLPGAAEIRRVQRALDDAALGATRILPLFGDLSAAEQDAALTPAPTGQRKIVLATSIAETSLTIEGVRVVIDSGLRRFQEFDPSSGMSRLVTGKASQAAADQRRGRAGRLASGVCYRLWSEGTQAGLALHAAPEIMQADLAPLALELANWGATDAASLRWLDPPPAAPLAQARDLLLSLEAIDPAGRVTPHGRSLSELGMHPRLAHMLRKSVPLGAARLACDLAAVLSERDILRAAPGNRDADMRLRAAVMRGDPHALPAGVNVDARALSQAKRSSALWQRQIAPDSSDGSDPHTMTGLLLAFAYPDRIGRARDTSGRYLLANGRGARFNEAQSLAKSEYLVAAEIDGAEREARIFLGAPLDLADLEQHFATHITMHSDIAWDGRNHAIRARRERRLGAIVLDARDLDTPDPQAMQEAAIAGIASLGIEALPWTPALRQWQARVSLLRRLRVRAPEEWPDVEDPSLLSTLGTWAPPWIVGISRREHFARIDLAAALHGMLSHRQREILERDAPTHLAVPTGSRIPIDYQDGDTPSVSVRLQEMFGLTATPSIAEAKMPLLLKLLSPAGRPVQVTRDLVSFWARGYHDVKKDLKGRYPKHYWPDDPYTAVPTRRARPRPSRQS